MDRSFSLFPRAKAPRIGEVSNGLLYLFLAFQLVDQIVLPILVATFLFSKSAKRAPTLINVCITWIITGIISSLLLYTGKHVGPEPPKMLCVTQAALLDGQPPMASVAVFALMYQAYVSIRWPKEKATKMRTYALLIAPYVTFFCYAMTAALLAVDHPENVTRARRFFYCSFKSKVFSNIYAVFTAVMLLATTGYEVAIGIFLFKNWRVLRQTGSLDIQSVGRVVVFGAYVFLALVLSLLSIAAPRSPIPDLFAASVGTVLTLIIGSQSDIYRAWLRRPLPTPPRLEYAPDDWVSVDVEQLRMGSNEKPSQFGSDVFVMRDGKMGDCKYEYGVGSDRVVDISAKFKEALDSPDRSSLDGDLAVDPDAKVVDISSKRPPHHHG